MDRLQILLQILNKSLSEFINFSQKTIGRKTDRLLKISGGIEVN